MILPSEVSPGSSEEEVQVLKEVTPRPATPNDSSKKVKPMKEQILNLTSKEEKVILQAAKQIRKKQVAEQNKALAATRAKSYEREKKEKVLDTRQLNFMSKHSTVRLTIIFDIFSGVNIKKKDLGLRHATNTEMSPPTISINNVITMKMPLKIANIYYLIPPPCSIFTSSFSRLLTKACSSGGSETATSHHLLCMAKITLSRGLNIVMIVIIIILFQLTVLLKGWSNFEKSSRI